MRRATGRLTYANVVSTLCLFLLLGGGAAFAASNLGKNSVGPKQLKKNAVTSAKLKKSAVSTAKLKDGAVTAAKLADGAVNGAKVADGSLTGADINQASLTGVRASNVTAISINGDATCSPALPLPAGVSTERPSDGHCRLTFPSSVTSCTATATVHLHLDENELLIVGARTAYVSNVTTTPNVLLVSTIFQDNNKANFPFDLVLTC